MIALWTTLDTLGTICCSAPSVLAVAEVNLVLLSNISSVDREAGKVMGYLPIVVVVMHSVSATVGFRPSHQYARCYKMLRDVSSIRYVGMLLLLNTGWQDSAR